MSEVSPDLSTHLEPPSKTTELEDSGAPESGMFLYPSDYYTDG